MVMDIDEDEDNDEEESDTDSDLDLDLDLDLDDFDMGQDMDQDIMNQDTDDDEIDMEAELDLATYDIDVNTFNAMPLPPVPAGITPQQHSALLALILRVAFKRFPPNARPALYQIVAAVWMLEMELAGNNGGFLADEPGIGKTKTCALLIAAASRGGRTLVVCDNATKFQWERELSILNRKKWKLTTYSAIRTRKRLQKLVDVGFHRIILDEGHAIKNGKSVTYRHIAQVESTTRWSVTGTPMTNTDKDLIAPMTWIKVPPHLRGDPMNYMLRRRIADLSKHFSELQLQSLASHNIILEFTPEEQKAYLRLLLFISTKLGSQSAKSHLGLVGKSIEACTVPSIVDPLLANASKPSTPTPPTPPSTPMALSNVPFRLFEDDVSNKWVPDERRNLGTTHLPPSTRSTKLDHIVDLTTKILSRAAEQNKVVIFVKNLSVLESLVVRLSETTLFAGTPEQRTVKVCVLCGSQKEPARAMTIESFNGHVNRNRKMDVMIAQVDVASQGLNLQAANYGIIVSPSWSPAQDKQIIARLWRRGQQRAVTFYRYIMRDSMEAYCLDVQGGKLQDINRLFDPDVHPGSAQDAIGASVLSGLSRDQARKAFWACVNKLKSIVDLAGTGIKNGQKRVRIATEGLVADYPEKFGKYFGKKNADAIADKVIDGMYYVGNQSRITPDAAREHLDQLDSIFKGAGAEAQTLMEMCSNWLQARASAEDPSAAGPSQPRLASAGATKATASASAGAAQASASAGAAQASAGAGGGGLPLWARQPRTAPVAYYESHCRVPRDSVPVTIAN